MHNKLSFALVFLQFCKYYLSDYIVTIYADVFCLTPYVEYTNGFVYKYYKSIV